MKQWPVLLSLFCATVSGQEQTVVRPLEPGTIHLKGWLGDKIDLCVQNGIDSRNLENLVAPFHARTVTSSFAKYSPLIGFRQEGEEHCGMGINCGTANGPRGLLLIPRFAVMREKSGIVLHLFETLQAVTQTRSGKSLIIRQAAKPHPGGLRFRGQHLEPGITVPGGVAVGPESHGTVRPLHQINV